MRAVWVEVWGEFCFLCRKGEEDGRDEGRTGLGEPVLLGSSGIGRTGFRSKKNRHGKLHASGAF